MNLPAEFLEKMKGLLGEDEYKEFLDSYDKPRFYGLRVNTLKISVEEFLAITDFKLSPIPWTKDGFYYSEEDNPGKHPHYFAGLYYIQEPSAMFPAVVIDTKPGDKVLDLCAAPGGKTVQIGADLKNAGTLVSNDINFNRVKSLVKNIELYGIKNAVVTNEPPKDLKNIFFEYFDKILVDAPCSGEGMFRKDEDMAKSWGKFNSEKCCSMQWDILRDVDRMLKPGGILLYSTCTFSPEEDEMMISKFTDEYKNYSIMQINKVSGICDGNPDWADGNQALKNTARLWPHKIDGEGHFVALLKKAKDNEIIDNNKYSSYKTDKKIIDGFKEFEKAYLNTEIKGEYLTNGNNLYCLPENIPDISGLKRTKFGWYLGSFENGKFEPSHALILALNKKDLKFSVDFESNSGEINKYLKGETLMLEGEKGYVGICVDGYTIGWAKQMGTMLKNLYPKGWRKIN